MNVIKLCDYQEDMKARIEKALRLHRCVRAQVPTGTGKTVLLAAVVESFLREQANCNVWIVAHRRELVSQIRETIERAFSKITPQWSLYPLLFPHLWGTETFLTLKEGSTFLTEPLFNSLYDPFGSPCRGQEPSGTRGCNRPPVLGTATL